MPIIVALLIIIILLLVFGPWLLVAIGALLLALGAAAIWVVQHIVIPALIMLGCLAAVAAGAAVLYFAFMGAKALLAKR